MAVTLKQLLSHPRITRVVQEIRPTQARFQQFFGFIPGRNYEVHEGTHFAYDIFNPTRNVAGGRANLSGPALIRPQVVGQKSIECYRVNESMPLYYAHLYPNRPIGGDYSALDVNGQNYIARQLRIMTQRVANSREYMSRSLFKGGFDLIISGEDRIPAEKGSGHITIDYGLPAANTGQISHADGSGNIFAVTLANPSTCKFVDYLMKLNASSEQSTGFPIRHLFCNNIMASLILQNDQVKSLGGTSNTVFSEFRPSELDRTPFEIRLRGIPWLSIHVNDMVLNLNSNSTTATKLVENNHLYICPDPSDDIAGWHAGSELIIERDGEAPKKISGFHTYTDTDRKPPRVNLNIHDIGVPALHVPSALYDVTAVF